MFKKVLIVACILSLAISLSAQTAPASNADEYEAAYAKRITKEYIHGVYIPKDLADAFVSLNSLIEKQMQAKYKYMSEQDAVEKLHFSFGRWITYNWGFYEGSRMSHYLKGLGIHHPDDMARFVMLSYHRNLNKKTLDVKKQLEEIAEKKKRQIEKKLETGTILHTEKRKRPKN